MRMLCEALLREHRQHLVPAAKKLHHVSVPSARQRLPPPESPLHRIAPIATCPKQKLPRFRQSSGSVDERGKPPVSTDSGDIPALRSLPVIAHQPRFSARASCVSLAPELLPPGEPRTAPASRRTFPPVGLNIEAGASEQAPPSTHPAPLRIPPSHSSPRTKSSHQLLSSPPPPCPAPQPRPWAPR